MIKSFYYILLLFVSCIQGTFSGVPTWLSMYVIINAKHLFVSSVSQLHLALLTLIIEMHNEYTAVTITTHQAVREGHRKLTQNPPTTIS